MPYTHTIMKPNSEGYWRPTGKETKDKSDEERMSPKDIEYESLPFSASKQGENTGSLTTAQPYEHIQVIPTCSQLHALKTHHTEEAKKCKITSFY
jgi:hypothetical protein